MRLVEFNCRSNHLDFPIAINPEYVISVIPDQGQNGTKTEVRMACGDQSGYHTSYKTVDDYQTVVGKINEAMGH